jgi:hypothetical protein
MTVQPRHIVCVLGNWKSFDDVERVIADAEGFVLDTEYSQLEHDDRMERAFDACMDRVAPSMKRKDDAAIENHTAVAYIKSPPLPAAAAQLVSARTLALVDAMFDAGGVAVKSESAGIAHGAARWRQLAKQARSQDVLERADALRLAFVRRPIGDDDDTLYSCGMHLLGERDIEVTGTGDVHDDLGWMDLLAIYLLAEKPERGVHDGEGFRQKPRGERRVLQGSACTRYESDDFMFNPYGYWRLTSPA